MAVICSVVFYPVQYPRWSHFFSFLVRIFFLQLNLKFEIEVLCKNLSLDINELKPGNLLKDKEKLKNLEEQLSAPKKEAKPPDEILPPPTTGCHIMPSFCSHILQKYTDKMTINLNLL